MRFSALCVLSLLSTASFAADVCTKNATRVDVCQVATDISESIRPTLPIALTRSLVLYSIQAIDNQIQMRAFFVYTEAFLLKQLRSGVSLDSVKAGVRDSAMGLACRPQTELKAFVGLGGSLEMVYLFSDAAHFLTVKIDRCANEYD